MVKLRKKCEKIVEKIGVIGGLAEDGRGGHESHYPIRGHIRRPVPARDFKKKAHMCSMIFRAFNFWPYSYQ